MKIQQFIQLFSFMICFNCFGQNLNIKNYVNLIASEELKENLSILASDALEGRGTGTRGQKMAAAFIASYFAEIGLKNPSDADYFQKFELKKILINGTTLNVNDNQYCSDDIVFYGNNPPQGLNTEDIIYMGYGDEQNYNLVEVSNKCVLILMKDSLGITWSKAVKIAHQKGAKEVFDISFPEDLKCQRLLRRLAEGTSKIGFMKMNQGPSEYEPQSFSIRSSIAAKLMNTSIDSLVQIADNFAVGFNKLKPVEIAYSVDIEDKIITTENVLGFLEGSDKADELLIISAHYDHVGIFGEEEDKIRNGADDNGSGTVALLNIAKAFSKAKEEGFNPRRSVLFAAFTAEEKGLYGSKYYVENPIFPIDKTISNLNIDMIGRQDTLHKDKSYVYILGSDRTSTDLHFLQEKVNEACCQIELDYTLNEPGDPLNMLERSDQWSFAQKNIPVLFYFSGLHKDYHKPSDEVDKIDFDLLTQRSRLIFYTAWEIANREETIALDKIDY